MFARQIQPAAIRRLKTDQRGAYMLELAILFPVFMLTIMGTFDLAFQAYAKAVLHGAVEFASRQNSLETAQSGQAAVDDIVRTRVGDVASFATLSFKRTNYDNFSDVDQPEDYSDSNGNGVRDANECFTDVNNNNAFDTNRGADGQGSGGDIVLYEVTMQYNRLFPAWQLLGQPQLQTISARGLLRSQPYTIQNTTSRVVCP